jgi:Protein of unknown function (DUF1592)/Protein of unknown function (DUF1588)/Protein of unknown function (DUF1595)/Protein of unknown function (DUF1585)
MENKLMKSQSLWRSSLKVAAVVPMAIACAGCMGMVGGDAGSSGSSSSSAPPGNGSGGGSTQQTAGGGSSSAPDPMMTVPVVVGQQTPESAGTLMMRRLTYREYAHILNDFFGTADPTGGWSPDVSGDLGFVAPNSVADLQVLLLNQTADKVVEAALTAGKLLSAGNLTAACQAPAAAGEAACVTQFISGFGLRAYRRPVSDAEQQTLGAQKASGAVAAGVFSTVRGLGLSYTESLAAVAKVMLQSPNFLYHWEIGPTKPVVGADGLAPLTQWQIASRLAMAIWETMPDDTLLQAAQAGQLSTADQITTQAVRMMGDARATQALFSFHQQWLLNVGIRIGDVTSIQNSSPLWTQAASDGVQTEFTQFLSSVYAPSGDGTLKTLFTAPYTYVNKDLAAIYGVAGPATGFAKVMLDPTQRAGVLTQTAFLASQATDVLDNPVYRGLSVYVKVLCGTINPPPNNVPAVNFTTTGTTRQSFDAHGSNACAKGCHALFDPPGFAFEHYDGVGQYRTTDNSLPVDSTGSFKTPAGNTMTFTSAVDLANQLASSSEAQACIDRQWTRYMMGRFETPAEEGSLELALNNAAKTQGFSLRDMLTTLLTSKSFTYRAPSDGEAL